MRRINYLFLALFATLAFAACSDDDDDKKEPEMAFCTVDQDPVEDKCKPFCENEENAEHDKCKEEPVDCKDEANAEHPDCKEEAVFVTPDPAVDLCKGQEAEYEAIESDIVDIATTAALGCGATNVNTEDEAEVAELNACVSLGIANADDVAITAECAYCTARVVACAAANCLGACASTDTPEKAQACENCRAEHNCEEGMVECQGFEDDTVYCEDDQAEGEDGCVVDCEGETPNHQSCDDTVYCEDDQAEGEDGCVVDCEGETPNHQSCNDTVYCEDDQAEGEDGCVVDCEGETPNHQSCS